MKLFFAGLYTEYSDLLMLLREMGNAKGWKVVGSISALTFSSGRRTVRKVDESVIGAC